MEPSPVLGKPQVEPAPIGGAQPLVRGCRLAVVLTDERLKLGVRQRGSDCGAHRTILCKRSWNGTPQTWAVPQSGRLYSARTMPLTHTSPNQTRRVTTTVFMVVSSGCEALAGTRQGQHRAREPRCHGVTDLRSHCAAPIDACFAACDHSPTEIPLASYTVRPQTRRSRLELGPGKSFAKKTRDADDWRVSANPVRQLPARRSPAGVPNGPDLGGVAGSLS